MRSSLDCPVKSPAARTRSPQPARTIRANARLVRRVHESATALEQDTGFVAEMLAEHVVWEAETYFEEHLPERYVGELARRAERLFEENAAYRRRVSGRQGLSWLECFFRHWLAGALAKEKPALFRRLSDGFKNGLPIPDSVTR